MAMRVRMGRLGRLLVVAAVLVSAAAAVTGCDEDPSTAAAIYSELYGWEQGYEWDAGYGWDEPWGGDSSSDEGDWASDAVETHLGNFVDYGDGVPWSTGGGW